MIGRAVVVLGLVAACSSDGAIERPRVFGGDRPVELQAPAVLEAGKRYPLLLVLHGYGATGFVQAAYFNVNTLPADGEALVLAPDGLVDTTGRQFWNADPSCCDFDGRGQDDVGYLGELLDDVIATWPVDGSRVMVIGHSNGGFMGYRMACERADAITTVAILAGNTSRPADACVPAKPVNMLVMHGTLDASIPYDADTGTIGAAAAASRWAQYDGCSTTRSTGAMLDLEANVDGAETHVETADGCPPGSAVTLWRHEGVGHIPAWTAGFKTVLWTQLVDHPRP